ncbi:MAG: hypothetical protein F6J93_33295 [Oscillatoria sp. SIO1A7]|nr:hypothetical protein [Oscillatoria sp. SIO1A7]
MVRFGGTLQIYYGAVLHPTTQFTLVRGAAPYTIQTSQAKNSKLSS